MGHEIEATTGLEILYTSAIDVYRRHAELLAKKATREPLNTKNPERQCSTFNVQQPSENQAAN